MHRFQWWSTQLALPPPSSHTSCYCICTSSGCPNIPTLAWASQGPMSHSSDYNLPFLTIPYPIHQGPTVPHTDDKDQSVKFLVSWPVQRVKGAAFYHMGCNSGKCGPTNPWELQIYLNVVMLIFSNILSTINQLHYRTEQLLGLAWELYHHQWQLYTLYTQRADSEKFAIRCLFLSILYTTVKTHYLW